MTTQQVIDKQIVAYNERNINMMMTLFSNDIKIFNFSDNKILIDGIGECEKMYTDLFHLSPKLHAEILNTIIFDNKVIVHESISGRNGSDEKLEQVIIFEVENEKINKISTMRK